MALIALAIPAATAFSAILGQGVRATGEGWEWMVGGPNPLEGIEAPVPGGLVRFAEQCAGRGEAVVYVSRMDAPVPRSRWPTM